MGHRTVCHSACLQAIQCPCSFKYIWKNAAESGAWSQIICCMFLFQGVSKKIDQVVVISLRHRLSAWLCPCQDFENSKFSRRHGAAPQPGIWDSEGGRSRGAEEHGPCLSRIAISLPGPHPAPVRGPFRSHSCSASRLPAPRTPPTALSVRGAAKAPTPRRATMPSRTIVNKQISTTSRQLHGEARRVMILYNSQ